LQARGTERTKIVERLRKASISAVERVGVAADSGGNWYNVVKAEHARLAFAAAISRVNPEGADWVMRGDTFDSNDARFLPRGAPVDRTATAFADALGFLLRTAGQVHFVDPHFQPGEPRFREPMSALLAIACDANIHRTDPASLFLHLSLGNAAGLDAQMLATRTANLRREIQNRLPSVIPAGQQIRVLVWDRVENQDNIHNRYVLTDRAGVLFGTGLDQQNGTGQTDDVCRLTAEQHAERMRLYNVSDPDFTPTFAEIDDTIVVGSRTAR